MTIEELIAVFRDRVELRESEYMATAALLRELVLWREAYDCGDIHIRGSNYGFSTQEDEANFQPVRAARRASDAAMAGQPAGGGA